MSKLTTQILRLFIIIALVFLFTLIMFFYMYKENYVKDKIDNAQQYLLSTKDNVQVATFKLRSQGYEISVEGEEISYFEFVSNDILTDIIKTVLYEHDDDLGDYLLVNGVIKITINETLLQNFLSDLNVIIVFLGLLFLVLTLFVVQYFLFTFISPIIKINKELEKISRFDFNGSININAKYELKEIVDNIDNIKVSLKSYTKNKSTLVSALIHEIKSPVSTISSVLQLNEMGHPNYGDEKTRTIIIDNIETILSITNMSLEVFEKQSIYKLEMVNIRKVVVSKLKSVEPILIEKGLEINLLNESPSWKVDAEVFDLIISNIVSNICNYSKLNTDVNILINKDELTFTNVIGTHTTVGTGKGLKLVESLLEDMNLKLSHYETAGKYHVSIRR